LQLHTSGVQKILTDFGAASTAWTAVAAVLIAMITISPKWLNWWSEREKWRHSLTPSAHPSVPSKGDDRSGRKRSKVGFVLRVLDTLFAITAMAMMLALGLSNEPVTLGHVSLLIGLGAMFVVSSLREW
jgi:hypothetical protein